MVTMNKLNIQKRVQILSCLIEGNSIRSTARITDTSKNTVTKLLCDLGAACAKYQDERLRNLTCKRLQCDEIWSFCYAKEKNVPSDKKGQFGYGDIWTWTAIDADTKLVPAWFVGNRDGETAKIFIEDLKSRLKNRVQLTTDGHSAYLEAVEEAFGCEIDYAMLVKLYGTEPEGEKRYSPAKCLGAQKHNVTGDPDPKHISTSYGERQNLTMRMSMEAMTRLTNAFSKKLINVIHSLSIYFMYYNLAGFIRSRVTPAMEARIADHVWSLEEIMSLMD